MPIEVQEQETKKCGIYQILNTLNGKRYIGSSRNIKERWAQHKRALKRGDHDNSFLQRSWNKGGPEIFEFKQLIGCEFKDLVFYEDLIIKGYKSNNTEFGYNLRAPDISVGGHTRIERTYYNPGEKYNRLTLNKFIGTNSSGHLIWECSCDCGITKTFIMTSVKSGRIKSCGCLRKEKAQVVGTNNLGRRKIKCL